MSSRSYTIRARLDRRSAYRGPHDEAEALSSPVKVALSQIEHAYAPLPRDIRAVVVGLGYVGLPLAVALADHFDTVGLDINTARIDALRGGRDVTGEVDDVKLTESSLDYATAAPDCAPADIYIVTVPTPIDGSNKPDLGPLLAATRSIGAMLRAERKPIVVYESTVYPGVTEDLCRPLLAEVSGLTAGKDFFVGYSPERINPGDRVHTVDSIVKVVAGENEEVTAKLAAFYGTITKGGVYRARSIKVAEAAKVIENAQRDINIAFVNEVTQILSRLDLSVWDVLETSRTKWNFLPFEPGFVGGHCIGVDPFYLSHCAQQLGHEAQVILAGRSTNDGMAEWVAEQIQARRPEGGRALILGLSFKENVSDVRNSKVADLAKALEARGFAVDVADPIADAHDAGAEYGIDVSTTLHGGQWDCVVGAVGHAPFRALTTSELDTMLAPGGLLVDLKNIWPLLASGKQSLTEGKDLWTL